MKTKMVCLLWLVASVSVVHGQPAGVEVILHNFKTAPTGESPWPVIRDDAGNLYGATRNGGVADAGTVFKIDTTGQQTVLHSFTGGANDGNSPRAGVIRDGSGNLYGATAFGGPAGAGVIYKIDASGNETILYSFTGGLDGKSPYAGVIADAEGNLYGTTVDGGTAGLGVVFKLATNGQETVLHSFKGKPDGAYPYAGFILDQAGNLYGTTYGGGAERNGTVYKIDTNGQETVLAGFPNTNLGGRLEAGVIEDADGTLYGAATGGGPLLNGTVFKIDKAGQETVLYAFSGGADGSTPSGGVVRDAAGNLYGSTTFGGLNGFGVIFKVDPNGQETVLHSFTNGADGAGPSGLVGDGNGNLLGATVGGGQGGVGVVFKIDSSAQELLLFTFPGDPDGAYPLGGLVGDERGSLYGTTESGGPMGGGGTVYKVDPMGHETLLYSFTGMADGGNPYSGALALDADGNLYGTTEGGGLDYGGDLSFGLGVVFKVDPAAHETVLHRFMGGADGESPTTGVVLDAIGNLYGTTSYGGSGFGSVYKLDPSGQETVLYSFTEGDDGYYPDSGLTLDGAGNMYGTAGSGGANSFGVIYKIDAAGQETTVYSFTGGLSGGGPQGGVILDSDGNFYGTAGGGFADAGVVYKLSAEGTETVLYSFTGGADGGLPASGVVRDAAGNLYGTTIAGGLADAGVVYKVDLYGNETVLYSFTGKADGGGPQAGVILDRAGNLYGTTSNYGVRQAGLIFKIEQAAAEKP